MKPDVYIEKGSEKIIVDTKYKLIETIKESNSTKKQVSQSDVYQMLAYSQYYKTEKCILLYPQFEESFENQLSSKGIGFNLQISTINLHLESNVGYKQFVEKLKSNLKSVVEK